MPYIKPEDRVRLDPAIDELAARIAEVAAESEDPAAFAGLLNYAATRTTLSVVDRRFGRVRYWIIALVTGTFKNVADEFYRRLAAPYEDKQIEANGDVDLYEKLTK